MIMVDLQKAFDIVSWSFSEEVLVGLGFSERLISRIMTCVTTSSFSIVVNGKLCDYFKW
jgi:hypothetical protein